MNMRHIDPKYRPSILLLISTLILMVFCLICRFCGIGYFANNYTPRPCSPIVQEIIDYLLKTIELILVLLILTKRKWYICVLIGSMWSCIYFIPLNTQVVFLLDLVYMLLMPLIVSKFKPEVLTYSIVYTLLIIGYQFLIMQSRYTINLDLKFNCFAGIASILDYKLFIINLYFIRRLITMEVEEKQIPAAEEPNYNGGHCLLFFGPEKLKNKAAIVGHIVGFPIFVIIYGCEYTAKLIKRSCSKKAD